MQTSLNDDAYQGVQIENDLLRQCLIEVQRRVRDKNITKLISVVLQGKDITIQQALKIFTYKSNENLFISQSGLPGESRIYNADIEYAGEFEVVWDSLSSEDQRSVRESIHKTISEEILSSSQDHMIIKQMNSSLYPRGCIENSVKGSMKYYWLPVLTKKGRRVIHILGITKDL